MCPCILWLVAALDGDARAWKLDYDFDPGWRFMRLAPDVKTPIAIEGQPGAWACGCSAMSQGTRCGCGSWTPKARRSSPRAIR
ncbi:MAG: hypothetical protein FJ278_03265 [Planctomycetes bacterium]|nr:hypothetical protein [Planctomycetota bacterium]